MDSKLAVRIVVGMSVAVGCVIGAAVIMGDEDSPESDDSLDSASEANVDVRILIDNADGGAIITWHSDSNDVDSWGYACGSEPETLDERHATIGSRYQVSGCQADNVVIVGEKNGERVRLD